MITILGPTACGKTKLAVQVADKLGGEIISADSRQVYSHMDIGTGKDLSEYICNGKQVPYHLINIAEPGTAYNLHAFMKDFKQAYHDIKTRNNKVIMCGGTGMYLEAVLKGYRLTEVPYNETLRAEMTEMSHEELVKRLSSLKTLHNTSDITDRKRLERAIEIETYYKLNPTETDKPYESKIFGLTLPRDILRKRITERLHKRLEEGMLNEVQELLDSGISPEQLIYYGLEYKYITLNLTGQLSYTQMVSQLNTAIHQFAKRQMTWFRRMEKQGLHIIWIDGLKSEEEKLSSVF